MSRSAPNKSLERCCMARSKREQNKAIAVAEVTANTSAINIRLNSPLFASRHKNRLAKRKIIESTLSWKLADHFQFLSGGHNARLNAHRGSLKLAWHRFADSKQTA